MAPPARLTVERDPTTAATGTPAVGSPAARTQRHTFFSDWCRPHCLPSMVDARPHVASPLGGCSATSYSPFRLFLVSRGRGLGTPGSRTSLQQSFICSLHAVTPADLAPQLVASILAAASGDSGHPSGVASTCRALPGRAVRTPIGERTAEQNDRPATSELACFGPPCAPTRQGSQATRSSRSDSPTAQTTL